MGNNRGDLDRLAAGYEHGTCYLQGPASCPGGASKPRDAKRQEMRSEAGHSILRCFIVRFVDGGGPDKPAGAAGAADPVGDGNWRVREPDWGCGGCCVWCRRTGESDASDSMPVKPRRDVVRSGAHQRAGGRSVDRERRNGFEEWKAVRRAVPEHRGQCV